MRVYYIICSATCTMSASSFCCQELCLRRVTSADNLSEDRTTHSDSTEEIIELKGDQFVDNRTGSDGLKLSSMDMWALGLTTAVGGHYFRKLLDSDSANFNGIFLSHTLHIGTFQRPSFCRSVAALFTN